MKQQHCSGRFVFLVLGEFLLFALAFSTIPAASASRPFPSPNVETTEDLTNTPSPTSTSYPTPTGTLVSSRSIVLDFISVTYGSGTTGLVVNQSNTCEPTWQGGLHCIFTGSGQVNLSRGMRSVSPYAHFHWSDNANAKNVYRYQTASLQHTNTFLYGDLVPLSFFPAGLTDGYHEWSGTGSYANCNTAGCDLRATFYLLAGAGPYTWTVDTTIAPVAIMTPTPTATATQTSTPTSTPTPIPTTPPPSSNYDRVAAVNYADQWAHNRNGNYPNFGTGCNCVDCTNYSSQVLHNGNYPLRLGNENPESPFEWWYKDFGLWYTHSNSWSAANWFNLYVHQYEYEFEVNPPLSTLEGGDFIVMDLRDNENENDPPDGIPDHIRVVVGEGYTSTDQADYECNVPPQTPPLSTLTLLADQHCPDRKHVSWDYNLNLNVHNVWFIHVIY